MFKTMEEKPYRTLNLIGSKRRLSQDVMYQREVAYIDSGRKYDINNLQKIVMP